MNILDYLIGIIFMVVLIILTKAGNESDRISRREYLIHWLIALVVSVIFGWRLVSRLFDHFLPSDESILNFSDLFLALFIFGGVISIPFFSIQLARIYYAFLHQEYVVLVNPGRSRSSTLSYPKNLNGFPLMLLLPIHMLYTRCLFFYMQLNSSDEDMVFVYKNGHIFIYIVSVFFSLLIFWYYHKKGGVLHRLIRRNKW